MNTIISISTILIILVLSGCKEDVKVVALKPEIKVDSSKLTPSTEMLNREFNISYEYEGRDADSDRSIQRNLKIKLTLLSFDTTNTNTTNLKLKVKNTSFEPFILDGENIYLLKKEEILGNLEYHFYRIEISPGKESEFTFAIPKSMATIADLIDIRKRSKDGLISAFQIKLN